MTSTVPEAAAAGLPSWRGEGLLPLFRAGFGDMVVSHSHAAPAGELPGDRGLGGPA